LDAGADACKNPPPCSEVARPKSNLTLATKIQEEPHLILRTRPDVVATWDDREVARRWLMLCPQRRSADSAAMPPTESEINSIANCFIKCDEIRKRLASISWWIRLLCQRVAQRANHEEEENGRFFQDRYRATRLVDEASLLACAAYVDLNPIRAAICQTLESSDRPSAATANRRDVNAMSTPADSRGEEVKYDLTATSHGQSPTTLPPDDAFLSPLTIDEYSDPIGPCASPSGQRCSDKEFLAMSMVEYLKLLEWLARQVVLGKRGRTPEDFPPVLTRLGLERDSWCELVSDFGKLICTLAQNRLTCFAAIGLTCGGVVVAQCHQSIHHSPLLIRRISHHIKTF